MFAQRTHKKELLDGPNLPFVDIQRNMIELNIINKYLGGHACVKKGLQKIMRTYPEKTNWKVAEIGCGDGNNIGFLKNDFIQCHFMGIDNNEQCIRAALLKHPEVEWIHASYEKSLEPFEKVDIIFSSLMAHHFSNEELIPQMNWMNEHAQFGFFIADLHRHPFAYYSIKILTRLFSKSYLIKNDAPLSVLRAFSKVEIKNIFQQTACPTPNISWQWAFRYLITVVK